MKIFFWSNTLQRKFLGNWVLCTVLLAISIFSEGNAIRVPVKPSFTSPKFANNIDTINNYAIEYTGNLVISNPTILQRLLLPKDYSIFSFTKIFPFWLYSLFMVIFLLKIQPPHTFKKDVSLAIKILGFSIIGFYLIEIFLHFYFIRPTISQLSSNKLIPQNSIDVMGGLIFLVGFALIKLSAIFKTGYQLQQEKELTI